MNWFAIELDSSHTQQSHSIGLSFVELHLWH